MKRLAFVPLALVFALPGCKKSDAELAERVEKLEGEVKRLRAVEDFIRPIMNQQMAQEADPDARFAVNVQGSPTLGPADAAVTVIEAFDFA